MTRRQEKTYYCLLDLASALDYNVTYRVRAAHVISISVWAVRDGRWSKVLRYTVDASGLIVGMVKYKVGGQR